jgi:glucose-6-phosphate-specific signal transduction histidine kinase
LRTTWKLLIGALSFIPLLFFAVFFFWLIPAFFAPRVEGAPSLFSQRFDSLLPVAISTSAILIALLVLYAALLYHRPGVHVGEKIAIPLGILLTNGIILPFVWWLYIWRESNMQKLSEGRLTHANHRRPNSR